MTDRENVIKGLMEISEYMRAKADIAGVGKGKEVFDSWYRAAEDALALLREQETAIVRCRNCRHYNTECCADGYGWCHNRDFGTTDEWYCADGEAETYETD